MSLRLSLTTCAICCDDSCDSSLACGHSVCAACRATGFAAAESSLSRGEAAGEQLTLLACPLCRVDYADAALPAALASLRSTLRRVAVVKLREQGLTPACACGKTCQRVLTGAPPLPPCPPMAGLALEHFAVGALSYFRCSSCAALYFGGLAVCDAAAPAAAAAAAAPLICPACTAMPPGVSVCAMHGVDGLYFKCLYCCSVATHICRAGTNLYCDVCHDISVDNASRFGTILDWKPIVARDAHRQCTGRDPST